ncbi:unnamed protein product, partial [Laminaria digitata]
RGEHTTAGERPTDLVGHGSSRRSSPDSSASTRQHHHHHHHQQRQQQRPRQLKIRRERRDGHGHGHLRTPLPVQVAAAALSSKIGNATQALLPFVPLLVEAPTLAAHARRAWPWLRAAATRHPFPFAFVSPPVPLPQRRQGALWRNCDATSPLRRRPATARAEDARFAARCLRRQGSASARGAGEVCRGDDLDAEDFRCRRRLGNAASPDGIGAGPSCDSSGGGGGGGAASAGVSRRRAIGEVVSLVGR